MEKRYCLKMQGRFAGRYETFSEKEVIWLRRWLIHVKRYALTDAIEAVIDKLIKVLEIRTVDE